MSAIRDPRRASRSAARDDHLAGQAGHTGHPGRTGDADPGQSTSSRRRLHVLHVTTAATDDVAEQTLAHVRDQLDRGWTVTLACPSRGPLGFEARRLGARVRWWRPAPGPLGTVALAPHRVAALDASLALRRAVAEVDADVAHLHGAAAVVAGRWGLRRRLPRLCSPDGDHPLDAAMTESFDEVGVDVTRWRGLGPADRARARLRHGVDAEAPLAVCVGPVAPDHGQESLVRAWGGVRAEVPGARLILVGDGPDLDRLRRTARVDGVSAVGGRADLADWFGAADVVVVPSPSGLLPVAAVQAMASARSVVVPTGVEQAAGLPAGIGVVAPVGHPHGVLAAVARRLADPALADEEGWQARYHVERHHDSAQVSRDLARIYPRLVAAGRR